MNNEQAPISLEAFLEEMIRWRHTGQRRESVYTRQIETRQPEIEQLDLKRIFSIRDHLIEARRLLMTGSGVNVGLLLESLTLNWYLSASNAKRRTMETTYGST